MNPTDNKPPTALLQWWLDVATMDLSESARKRIAPEIELHYRDAVEAHLAQGVPESTACQAALAELGEPSLAARRFREDHLTAGEELWLLELKNSSGSFWRQILNCLWVAFCLFAFVDDIIKPYPRILGFVWAIAVVLSGLNFYMFAIVKRGGAKSIFSSLLEVEILKDVAILCMVAFCVRSVPFYFFWPVPFLVYEIGRTIRCRKKISGKPLTI